MTLDLDERQLIENVLLLDDGFDDAGKHHVSGQLGRLGKRKGHDPSPFR